MKRKELKFMANLYDGPAHELLKHDIEKIQELNPGFQAPLIIAPLETRMHKPVAPIRGKTNLSMPIKKEKKGQ